MVRLAEQTIQIWAVLLSLVSILLAVSYFYPDIIPFSTNVGMYNGIILFIIGITIVSETVFVEKDAKSFASVLAYMIAAIMFVLALFIAMNVSIPTTWYGAIGIFYMLGGITMVLKVFF